MKKQTQEQLLKIAKISVIALVILFGFVLIAVRQGWVRFPERKPMPVTEKVKGRIVIILDDFGYNDDVEQFFRDLTVAVTVSILPQLPHSREVALMAHAHHKEIMVHLPLEPHRYTEQYPADYIIKTAMDEPAILALVKKFFNDIPYAVGTNNHMGSKATEDERLMRIIFTFLKSKKFFFVDSVVSPQSICRRLAKSMGVPFLRRHVFLDNEADPQYITGQLRLLARQAAQNGYAVGIGHDRALTRQVLLKETKALSREGYRFLTVKEMIHYVQTHP